MFLFKVKRHARGMYSTEEESLKSTWIPQCPAFTATNVRIYNTLIVPEKSTHTVFPFIHPTL